MNRSPFALLLALLLGLAGCPTGGDDDDSASNTDDDDTATDDDDTVADDDDTATDDDDTATDDDDTVGDDDDTVGDDDDTSDEPFAPSVGTYDYGLIQYGQNDCAASQSDVGAGFDLGSLNLDNETFTLTYDDTSQPQANCYFDQTLVYVCNQTNASYSLAPIGMPNATISRQSTGSGTFTSPTVANHAETLSMNCSGSQCGVAAQVFGMTGGFPCTTTLTTTATFVPAE